MDQITVAPPPLPPKTRRSPPDTPTVLSTPSDFDYSSSSYREVDRTKSHVVKIHINPEPASPPPLICDGAAPCIRISVNGGEMVQTGGRDATAAADRANYFFYNCAVMSSGQVSPSDTLDSGTCSDLDGTTPPPSQPPSSKKVSVTLIGGQLKRASSAASSGAEIDSDDNESNLSCDSLNSGKMSPVANGKVVAVAAALPRTLLQDIRERSAKLAATPADTIVKSYEERKQEQKQENQNHINNNNNNSNNHFVYETDMFYNFHLNEHISEAGVEPAKNVVEDESFAGYKDLLGDGASTIRSAKGTVRGVKNRVRAGIATFLQINSNIKTYKEKDAGKVVVYTTTMGILRDTYQACMKVKQILRTLLVKFEERDVFMSSDFQAEIRERMRCDHVLVPQVFVDGQHVGDAETIERLNESGELRRILKPYKSMDACTTCQMCGGYRLLPCQVCNGSKKSVHRNHFTAEFVALKCMNCDEVGLVRCTAC